ncbi:MAG: protein kinase [Deltaproteobacteria bacterium]|nr:protein kinase [Deltaproteobacteria bacterium]
MAQKTSWLSKLSFDPIKRAQDRLKAGRLEEAMELFAKGGDFRRATRLAAELRNQSAAVKYAMRAVLGEEADTEATPLQAGELLATAGHHLEAFALFEIGGAYAQAAQTALKLRQTGRAARYFEQAKDWASAALYYERSGKLENALTALQHEAGRLKREKRPTGALDNERQLQEVEIKKAELLQKLGRSGEAATQVLDAGPSLQGARLLEKGGNYREALDSYLKVGSPREALRLLPKVPELDKQSAAEIYLKCGKPAEAGRLFAAGGYSKQAAQAFESAEDWVRAATNWEAAREHIKAAGAYEKAGRLSVAARCLASGGLFDRATETYLRAGEPEAAADCRLKAGKPLEAATVLIDANKTAKATVTLLGVDPNHPSFDAANLLLIRILVQQEQFEKALERLARIPASRRASGPIAIEALLWGGRAFEGLARADEARNCYLKILTLEPKHREATDRLAALAHIAGTTRLEISSQAPAEAATPTVSSKGTFAKGILLAERYEIQGEVARGGMGRVYRALDRELGEVVALKTLLQPVDSDKEEEARLLREVQICRKITHPNIVRVYDLGRFEGGIFVTMELLEGQPLDSLLENGRQLPFAQIKGILMELLAGLEEAHSLGVVHRDLKPGNVFLTSGRLKILDFGIARMDNVGAKLTQTGTAIGSPLYMSPEQLQGSELDGRSDLYSLGTLTYALLAGQEPFLGRQISAIFLAQLSEEPPDVRDFRPDTPLPWISFLKGLLAKKPEERYGSAKEVMDVVRTLPG